MKRKLAVTLATIFIVGIVAFIFHKQHPKHTNELLWTPQARLGVQNNQCAVYIVDHRGEEFMMDWEFFKRLLYHGGYNAVIRQYYTKPGDPRFFMRGSFVETHDTFANSINTDFTNSYSEAIQADTLYDPTVK